MYSYIDKLLSIKLEKYKKQNEEKKSKDIDKSKSEDYMDSYIEIIYNKLDNENAFKNKIEKYTRKNQKGEEEDKKLFDSRKSQEITMDKEKEKNLNISNISSISIIQDDDSVPKNIIVISSDICGLGKSFKIKKMIEKEKREYYHFPLGGKLTKNVIYQKICNLFKKIKNAAKLKKESNINSKNNNDDEEYSEFNNVAIHLDLIETKETNLINEFLFSFLITKFYAINENIIYIPNNIKIYIEIPNSFENYLTKFGILNAFNIENIVFEKKTK
jgi:hypothetical protein